MKTSAINREIFAIFGSTQRSHLIITALACCQILYPAFGVASSSPDHGGEDVGNNLSMPAVIIGGTSADPVWNVGAGTFGVDYSYGCDKPESYTSDNPPATFTYPNTSCVQDLMAVNPIYLTAEECTSNGPCSGYVVSKIYWQKVTGNKWAADLDGVAKGTSIKVHYLDWGDALEAVSWNEQSVIRVETQPYTQFEGYDPDLPCVKDSIQPCKLGWQMWHVSGQGTTEKWGVRTYGAIDDIPIPYSYRTIYQIINTDSARLNIAKMANAEPGSIAQCPTNYDTEGYTWSKEEKTWSGYGICPVSDIPFSVELSVTGKYVYGYNLRMNKIEDISSICEEAFEKSGYWRLTFYTTDDAIVFSDATIPLEAPEIPATQQEFSTASETLSMTVSSDSSGPLYTPTIDSDNNITYIDICIEAKEKGGGNGGNGGPTGSK